MMTRVVTWSSPNSLLVVNVCRECAASLTADKNWPRDHRGQEACQVYRGEHRGYCDVHPHKARS